MVTGANTGIGRATALGLAELGATVVLACRSPDKADAARDWLLASTGNERIEVLHLDLGDMNQIRSAATTLLSNDQPLHLLVNNAGIAGQRGQTADGFELAFGTNHLGHFLFTTLVLHRLEESAPARVVNVSSGNHFQPKDLDLDRVREPTRTFVGLREYNTSKLCNVLFTSELARRFDPQVLAAFSSNPGPVASDIWRRMPGPVASIFQAVRRMKSTDEGAKSTLRAATDPTLVEQSGAYIDDDCRVIPTSPVATPERAARLWELSEAWTAG